MYISRYYTEFSYIGFIFDHRVAIYYIYEEETKGSEIDLCWDMRYRFNKKILRYGQQQCMDFDDDGVTMVTGTNAGWVLVWNISERKLRQKTILTNPNNDKPLNISMVRDICD